MSTSIHNIKSRRPEGRDIDDLIAEAVKREDPKKGYDKKHTTIKAAASEETGEFEAGVSRPTDEQLEKINRFTRSPKTADEVAVIPTLACNDMIDRSVEKFTTETIHDFTKLPDGLNPIGKSYMVGHDYSKLPVGRIFDQEVKNIQGTNFLALDAYIPNTPQYKSYLENVDFGVYWAVSVGVVIGKATCDICKEPMYQGFFGSWCKSGHEKGFYYDPKSDERDDWGFQIPVDEKAKGAQLAVMLLEEPKDFYELSQVYLGAQYMAEVEKNARLSGIVKAASVAKLPVIGLTKEEADELPQPVEDEKVLEAIQRYTPTQDEDGTLTWVDDDQLVWVYDPKDEGSVYCLGRKDTEGEEAPEPTGDDGASEEEPETSETTEDEGSEEEDMSKEVVLASATKAKLPLSILEKISDAEGLGLDEVFSAAAERIEDLEKQVGELSPKVQLGEAYVKDLKSEVIDWYVKANQDDKSQKVDVSRVEKLLATLGDGVDSIKVLRDEFKEKAQMKFPSLVRRSTFEANPEERDDLAPVKLDKKAEKAVGKIHG